MGKWDARSEPSGGKDEDAAAAGWLADTPDPLLRAPLIANEIVAPLGSSGEIAEADDDSDVESATRPCCRICLEHNNRRGKELISPCMCKGTQQFVHRSCLDQWRSTKEGFAFSHCTTCKAQYHLRVELKEAYWWRKLKFQFFVTKDILLVILFIQIIITAFGSMAYLVDTYLADNYFRNFFSHGWFHALSEHSMPFYYCLGVLVSLVIFGVYGAVMDCSSWLNSLQTDDSQVVDHNSTFQSGYVPVMIPPPEMYSSSFSRDDHSISTDHQPDDGSQGTDCSCFSAGSEGTNCNCFSSDCSLEEACTDCNCFSSDCEGTNCNCSSSDCSSGEYSSECCCIFAIILVVIFAILGIFYVFFAATKTFREIWQRHYHILEKRELTKVYVVEDLHGNYSPPKLAPEHETHLKLLKLL